MPPCLEPEVLSSDSEAMGSEAASTQPLLENKSEFPRESHQLGIQCRIETRQVIQHPKQLKSSEILRSAVPTSSSNSNFMLLMIMSILPLCAFMIFYEIKLQKTIQRMPTFLDRLSLGSPQLNFYQASVVVTRDDDATESQYRFYTDFLQLCVFYFVIYPLLEIFSVFITIKLAAKTHLNEPRVTEKEVIDHNNLNGTFITYLCVHLLSVLTFLGLFWVVVNQYLLLTTFSSAYDSNSIEFYLNIHFIGLHAAIVTALLFNYLRRSVVWNMGMVISVLEEETGIGAFGLSDYYGKHFKQAGVQLMVIFFTFCNGLRLPALFFGLCNSSFAGICVTAIVIGIFCLGNLVKWVAFVLYFYDCKQKVMEKKDDEGVGKFVKKIDDAC